MSVTARKNTYIQLAKELPEPNENTFVARIYSSKGGDLFDVEIVTSSGIEIVSAIMPAKYMNVVWVKNGDLVMIERQTTKISFKITYDITHILNEQQLKHILKIDKFPEQFMNDKTKRLDKSSFVDIEINERILNNLHIDGDDDELELPGNPNHVRSPFEDSSDSDDDEDEDEDGELYEYVYEDEDGEIYEYIYVDEDEDDEQI